MSFSVTAKDRYARAYTYDHQYNLLLGLAGKMAEESFRLLVKILPSKPLLCTDSLDDLYAHVSDCGFGDCSLSSSFYWERGTCRSPGQFHRFPEMPILT
jgi:hypothetical protein